MPKLTADLVEAFAGVYLSPRYDEPQPTPPFHREVWALYTSDEQSVGCDAPRDHAKSTGLTFVYGTAEVCFRTSDYVILVGSTEDMAAEQLSNIKEELAENDDLRRDFKIASFEKEATTDIIVVCTDGHRFRILARGSEQKIRGKMWKGKRPNLLLCDDMEDDEQVENKDRRSKFRRWFFRAARQAVSQSGKIRVHGTILHEDSLLARLKKNKTWSWLSFRAHTGFDDFSNILWPERWTETKLRKRREEFIEDGDAAGYSQEFLNDPLDNSEAYLRRDDFLPMADSDRELPKRVGIGADFAVSKADRANRTSFTVGGKDVNNILHIIDQRVGRWDPVEWLDVMFKLQTKYNPDFFWVEGGVIWKAVSPFIYKEMQVRDKWINFIVLNPVKDKATRGRPLQRRMRGGGVRFDKQAEWYETYEYEMLRFTGYSQATLDDQFDSTATLAMGFENETFIEEEDFMSQEELDDLGEWNRRGVQRSDGRSSVTGY